MDVEEISKLAESYRELSDKEILELLQSGPDNFEKEAYDLLLMEGRRRRIEIQTLPVITKETGKPLENMTRTEILELFMSAPDMDKDSYDALCDEALRRDISPDEIDQYRIGISETEKDEEGAGTIPNPLPLIITENLDEAQPFFKALAEANIPCSIQIMVDEKDYEKAEEVTNHLQPISNS